MIAPTLLALREEAFDEDDVEHAHAEVGVVDERHTALQELQHNAEETAIANGLLENARSNAETILKGFFTKAYDLDKYTLTFE